MSSFRGARRWFGMAVVVMGAAAGAGAGREEAAVPKKLTGEAEKAAQRMVAAAQKACDAMAGMEGKGQPSLTMVDMEIEWSRNLGNAQVLLDPEGAGRHGALEGHLERVSKMAGPAGGALPGFREDLEYAVAQAQFALAADGVTGEMSSAMRTDAEKMVRAAGSAYDGLMRTLEMRPVTPELFELRIAWSRRRVRSESMLQTRATQRLPLVEAHLKRMDALAAWVEESKAEAKGVLRAQAAYGAAEADFMAEANAAEAGKMTKEARAAAEQMVKQAEAVVSQLQTMGGTRLRTAEVLNLELAYSRKLAEAGMAIHPKGGELRQVLEEYVKRAQGMEKVVKGGRGDAVQEGMAEYAVAEAEYWLASEK